MTLDRTLFLYSHERRICSSFCRLRRAQRLRSGSGPRIVYWLWCPQLRCPRPSHVRWQASEGRRCTGASVTACLAAHEGTHPKNLPSRTREDFTTNSFDSSAGFHPRVNVGSAQCSAGPITLFWPITFHATDVLVSSRQLGQAGRLVDREFVSRLCRERSPLSLDTSLNLRIKMRGIVP